MSVLPQPSGRALFLQFDHSWPPMQGQISAQTWATSASSLLLYQEKQMGGISSFTCFGPENDVLFQGLIHSLTADTNAQTNPHSLLRCICPVFLMFDSCCDQLYSSGWGGDPWVCGALTVNKHRQHQNSPGVTLIHRDKGDGLERRS